MPLPRRLAEGLAAITVALSGSRDAHASPTDAAKLNEATAGDKKVNPVVQEYSGPTQADSFAAAGLKIDDFPETKREAIPQPPVELGDPTLNPSLSAEKPPLATRTPVENLQQEELIAPVIGEVRLLYSYPVVEIVTTSGGYVNVRSNPNVSAEDVGDAQTGARYVLLGENTSESGDIWFRLLPEGEQDPNKAVFISSTVASTRAVGESAAIRTIITSEDLAQLPQRAVGIPGTEIYGDPQREFAPVKVQWNEQGQPMVVAQYVEMVVDGVVLDRVWQTLPPEQQYALGGDPHTVIAVDGAENLTEVEANEIVDQMMASEFGNGSLHVYDRISTRNLGDIIVATPAATMSRWNELSFPAEFGGVRDGTEVRIENAVREAWLQLLTNNDGTLNQRLSREEAEQLLDSEQDLIVRMRIFRDLNVLAPYIEDSARDARLTQPVEQLMTQFPHAIEEVSVNVRSGVLVEFHPRVTLADIRSGIYQWMIPWTYGEFGHGVDISMAYGLRVQNGQLILDVFTNPLGANNSTTHDLERVMNNPTFQFSRALGSIPHYANGNPTLVSTSHKRLTSELLQILGQLVPGVRTEDDAKNAYNSANVDNTVFTYNSVN